MGALHRFFIPPESWVDSALVLRTEEAHHCRDVLRHAAGDEVEVFQGRGKSAVARIRAVTKSEVSLEALRLDEHPKLPVAVVLAQALPKGKLMDLIVQKATEIGVARIVPLLTERTIVRPEEEDRKREKWTRVALEACKQCGQNWLPELAPVQTVAEFLRNDRSEWRLVAALAREAKRLREMAGDRRDGLESLSIAIGPEGDFTPAELDQFRSNGAGFLSLGPNVLRSETAAIYALSALSQEYF